MDQKLHSQIETREIEVGWDDATTEGVLVRGGTHEDVLDMTRLGKK